MFDEAQSKFYTTWDRILCCLVLTIKYFTDLVLLKNTLINILSFILDIIASFLITRLNVSTKRVNLMYYYFQIQRRSELSGFIETP